MAENVLRFRAVTFTVASVWIHRTFTILIRHDSFAVAALLGFGGRDSVGRPPLALDGGSVPYAVPARRGCGARAFLGPDRGLRPGHEFGWATATACHAGG